MPRLRPLRKAEDIAAVPPDEPVMIDLEGGEEAPPVEKAAESAETPEQKAKPKEEPAVEAASDESDPDPRSELQKQIDELKRAEEAVKRQLDAERKRADDAQRLAASREEEVNRHRGDAEQAQYDMTINAIAAGQAEADAAQRDWEAADVANDAKAKSEATRRMMRAEAAVARFEDIKAQIEAKREEAKNAPPKPPASPTVEQQIDAIPTLSSRQKAWLKLHTDAVTNTAKNARLGAAHYDAIDEGHAADSDEYFAFLEERLGYRKPAARQEEPTETSRSQIVSAPVSRETPSVTTGKPRSSQVTLTPEEREIARSSKITETEYARQKLRLQELKKNGHYAER